MVAFIILLLFCLVSVAGGYALRRVDWQAIERDNERYYTSNGYHVYYDRKILRCLRDKEQETQEPNDEN